MKLTVKAGGVPSGGYVAKLLGVERKDSAFGPGLLWIFEVIAGTYTGAKTTGMTGLEPTAGNKCGRFLAGVGENVDLTAYVGKMYLVVVEQTDKSGARITNITAPPTA